MGQIFEGLVYVIEVDYDDSKLMGVLNLCICLQSRMPTENRMLHTCTDDDKVRVSILRQKLGVSLSMRRSGLPLPSHDDDASHKEFCRNQSLHHFISRNYNSGADFLDEGLFRG